MYSSSLEAPAVSGVSMDEPPPTNRATHVVGPDTSSAAALTSPTVPVCRWQRHRGVLAMLLTLVCCVPLEGFEHQVCNQQRCTAGCLVAMLQICKSGQMLKTPVRLCVSALAVCQKDRCMFRAYLELWCLWCVHVGHNHARQGLGQRG